MASPWVTTTHTSQAERPWMGMAMLAAVPILALILIRLFWSGSSLWFLTVGIILLGAAAITFLARRTQEQDYTRQVLTPEATRLPLVLTGLGVLFLAMLIVPNYSGGGPSNGGTVPQQPAGLTGSEAAGVSQPPAQAPVISSPAVVAPEEEAAPATETYVVLSGDTLWDIALRFDTTVEAIVAANNLASDSDLSLDQELIIPAASGTDDAEDVPPVIETIP